MTDITKHDSEEEGEGNDSKDTWVNFFVHWDTISVNDLLESGGEFIHLQISGRLNIVVLESLEVSGWELRENISDLLFLFAWAPEITNVC